MRAPIHLNKIAKNDLTKLHTDQIGRLLKVFMWRVNKTLGRAQHGIHQMAEMEDSTQVCTNIGHVADCIENHKDQIKAALAACGKCSDIKPERQPSGQDWLQAYLSHVPDTVVTDPNTPVYHLNGTRLIALGRKSSHDKDYATIVFGDALKERELQVDPKTNEVCITPDGIYMLGTYHESTRATLLYRISDGKKYGWAQLDEDNSIKKTPDGKYELGEYNPKTLTTSLFEIGKRNGGIERQLESDGAIRMTQDKKYMIGTYNDEKLTTCLHEIDGSTIFWRQIESDGTVKVTSDGTYEIGEFYCDEKITLLHTIGSKSKTQNIPRQIDASGNILKTPDGKYELGEYSSRTQTTRLFHAKNGEEYGLRQLDKNNNIRTIEHGRYELCQSNHSESDTDTGTTVIMTYDVIKGCTAGYRRIDTNGKILREPRSIKKDPRKPKVSHSSDTPQE